MCRLLLLPSSQVFDSSIRKGRRFNCTIGVGQVIKVSLCASYCLKERIILETACSLMLLRIQIRKRQADRSDNNAWDHVTQLPRLSPMKSPCGAPDANQWSGKEALRVEEKQAGKPPAHHNSLRPNVPPLVRIGNIHFLLSVSFNQGWDEGVPKMSLGEKAILRCTSDYAYGRDGAGGVIPPNAGGSWIPEYCVRTKWLQISWDPWGTFSRLPCTHVAKISSKIV